MLAGGHIAVIDALLEDNDLPHGPPTTPTGRHNALAVHIGTMQV